MNSRPFRCLLLAVGFLLVTNCGSLRIKSERGPAGPPAIGPPVSLSSVPLETASTHWLAERIQALLRENRASLGGMVGLLFLWSFAKAVEVERRRSRKKLTDEDLALLKIIKENSARMWRNQSQVRKVTRLEDWKS